MFSAGLWTYEHQEVIFWAKFPLSYAKAKRQRPLKGDKQVNHIIALSQITQPQKNSNSRFGTGNIA